MSCRLTPGEWPEWGNPITDKAAFDLIRSYSPYDNVEAKAYPPMLIMGGLNDPRVTYWEPAKWAAKLRATKTDSNLLLLKTEMGAGHGGKSGRWDALREDAEAYAFVLTGDGGAREGACSVLVALFFAVPGMAEPARVTVTRQGDSFVADLPLPTDAPGWGFWRSSPAASDNQSWRLKSWKVLTPGVTLERRGQQDAFVGVGGRPVPRRVRVRLTPYTGEVASNYVPALRLGGDSVALFRRPFCLVRGRPRQPARPAAGRIRPGGRESRRLWHGGRVSRPATCASPAMRTAIAKERAPAPTACSASPAASVANGIATVIDSELPQWIADDLATFTPQCHGRA
jgi:hypothetical protein